MSFADSIGLSFAAKTESGNASENLHEDTPEYSIGGNAVSPEISNSENENSSLNSEINTNTASETDSEIDSESDPNSEAEQLPANVASGSHQIITTDLSRNPGADKMCIRDRYISEVTAIDAGSS